MKNNRIRLSHTQIIALGFFTIIIIGALLLTLPISSNSGEFTSFFDCLFTATSAGCVTGLVVLDTATHWSLFGQIVIILLIQLGGLGFMTFITFFFMLMRKKVGLKERQLMTESINVNNIGGILSLTGMILKGTLLFEGIGAILLSIRFIPQFGVAKGIWYSIFHSISAFCNAGFDLFGKGNEFCSLVDYSNDPLVNITIMSLIIIGGLGFIVWDDIRTKKLNYKKYKLQTKIVLISNLILIFGGAILFFFFEKDYSASGKDVGERILMSLFDSVTPRTAGFNTSNISEFSTPSMLLSVILMFIGGNPGSTAGGVKTTSIVVILIFALCEMKREPSANVCGRRISTDTLRQAIYIVFFNLSLAVIGSLIITFLQNFSLADIFFETFSAIGTVGMTTGITRDLLPLSRLIIILLMYFGRVGSVSFALAMMERKARPAVTYPRENINVG